MSRAESDRRVRSLRPPKRPVDPWLPLDRLVERERLPGGGVASSLTLFLAGAECPFTCVFCDLWRYTLDGPTPPGAIPAQIEHALRDLEPPRAGITVKLYNASNFFDERAVPRADWPAIADLLAGFPRVVVECHPRLVGEDCVALAELLEGRLEVAMGLETAHPGALERLNKRMGLADFERAAATLRAGGLGVRAFVLVGAPYLPPGESVDWAVTSVDKALRSGADVVSLIAVRGGNGLMDRLRESGEFVPPELRHLEEALDRSLDLVAGSGRVVLADLWEADLLEACLHCRERRLERIERANLTGRPGAALTCRYCSC